VTKTTHLLSAIIPLTMLSIIGCGNTTTPTAPAPPAAVTTANVYILPGGVNLGANAFGDEPIVIYMGERMRWRNLDTLEHTVVADTAALPEFSTTGTLAPGGERSFVMNTPGTTRVHCADHPDMVGILVVRER